MKLRDAALEPLVLVPKAIDNSGIVREVDPRARRDLRWVFALVLALVAAVALYAWPGLELRRASQDIVRMNRDRERLLEQNRKLRLEKASLEQLGRIETIAVRDLGLVPPPPERVVIVEPQPPLAPGARLAERDLGKDVRN